jgi:hypothetical protein
MMCAPETQCDLDCFRLLEPQNLKITPEIQMGARQLFIPYLAYQGAKSLIQNHLHRGYKT